MSGGSVLNTDFVILPGTQKSPEDDSRKVGIAQDFETWVSLPLPLSPERSEGRYGFGNSNKAECKVPSGRTPVPNHTYPVVKLLGYGHAP